MSLPESLPRVECAEQLPDAAAGWAATAAAVWDAAEALLTAAEPSKSHAMDQARAYAVRSHAHTIGAAQPAKAAADWMDAARRARRDVTPDRREAAGHAQRRDALAADAVAAWNSAAARAEEHLAALHTFAAEHAPAAPPPAPAARPLPSYR